MGFRKKVNYENASLAVIGEASALTMSYSRGTRISSMRRSWSELSIVDTVNVFSHWISFRSTVRSSLVPLNNQPSITPWTMHL